MRAYVTTTGIVFTLITLVHVWRVVEERTLATQPWFILITIISASFAVWAWRLAGRNPSRS